MIRSLTVTQLDRFTWHASIDDRTTLAAAPNPGTTTRTTR